jgi:DNA invertase Pin-like site-specific DNA recombinase
MLIGYARVSTHDQTEALQIDALRKAGCGRIFTDTASGAKSDRPGLAQALDYVREGDTLVVWRLDRLGRSLKDLIEIINNLAERSVGFQSLTEGFDTTTPGGKLVFHLFGVLAEFERELLRERTMAGLAAARARGRMGGRKRKMTAKDVAMARTLMADKTCSPGDIAKRFEVSKSTLYRRLAEADSCKTQEDRLLKPLDLISTPEYTSRLDRITAQMLDKQNVYPVFERRCPIQPGASVLSINRFPLEYTLAVRCF